MHRESNLQQGYGPSTLTTALRGRQLKSVLDAAGLVVPK